VNVNIRLLVLELAGTFAVFAIALFIPADSTDRLLDGVS
jgi:hypothetical protein